MSQHPTPEDIESQLKRLAQCRTNVRLILEQVDNRGGKNHANIDQINTIASNRSTIAKCKSILRGWDVLVKDMPEDDDGERMFVNESVIHKQNVSSRVSYRYILVLFVFVFPIVFVVARSIINFPVSSSRVSPSAVPGENTVSLPEKSRQSTILAPGTPLANRPGGIEMTPPSTSESSISTTPAVLVKYGVIGQGERQTTFAPLGVCALYFYEFGGPEKTFVFRSNTGVFVQGYNGTLSCWHTLPKSKDVGTDHPSATLDEVSKAGVTFSGTIVEVDPKTLP